MRVLNFELAKESKKIDLEKSAKKHKSIIDRTLTNWRFMDKKHQKMALEAALKMANQLPDRDWEKNNYIASVQKQIDFLKSMGPL